MNYALLSYNNATYSTLGYTPFQVIKSKLDYKNPLELSEEDKLTHFIQEHSEGIKMKKEQLHQQLSQQKGILNKRNENRTEKINIDISKPIFEKTFSIKSKKKETNKYKELKPPAQAFPTKVITQKRMIYVQNLEPQRIVSDNHDPSTFPANTLTHRMVLRRKSTS